MRTTSEALCRLLGPERGPQLFHDDDQYRTALAICQQCPVQSDCLEANIREEYGVWACSARARKDIAKLTRDGRYRSPAERLAHARRVNARNIGRDRVELPAVVRVHLARTQPEAPPPDPVRRPSRHEQLMLALST